MSFVYNSPPRKLFSFQEPDFSELQSQDNFKYAGLEYVLENSIPYVKELLLSIPAKNTRKHQLVDVKVKQLEVGQYPCLSGWHTDGTLNILEESRPENHYIFISGAECFTRFLNTKMIIDFDYDKNSSIAPMPYKKYLDKLITNESTIELEENTIYAYDRFSLHKPQPAKKDGFRFLLRLTESDIIKPINKRIRNDIR